MQKDRKLIIAGNWKMNKGPAEAEAFAQLLKLTLATEDWADVAVAPPFPSIPAVARQLRDTGIDIAAQNLHADYRRTTDGWPMVGLFAARKSFSAASGVLFQKLSSGGGEELRSNRHSQ